MARSIVARTALPGTSLDVAVLTGVAVLLPLLVGGDDPLCLTGPFYWPVLAPLVLGLRHGFLVAAVAVALLVGAQALLGVLGAAPWPDPWPLERLAGYVVTVLLVGEFSDQARRQVLQAETRLEAIRARLTSFRQRYFVLNASHHLLERRVAARSLTLDEAVQALQAMFDADPDDPLAICAEEVLAVLVQFANVQSASIHGVDENDRVLAPALATVGDPPALSFDDALVRAALSEKRLLAIRGLERGESSAWLAVIPLVDGEGTLHGLIAVERIQFFALNQQTLTLLGVLASNIADHLYQTEMNPVLRARDGVRFMVAVRRAQQLEQRLDVPAHLLVLEASADGAAVRAFFEHVETTRRRLERYFRPNSTELLVLLELGDDADVDGLLERLEQWCRETLGDGLEGIGVRVAERITFPLAAEALARLETRCAGGSDEGASA